VPSLAGWRAHGRDPLASLSAGLRDELVESLPEDST